MNRQEAVVFLFTIAKEIKRSFEKPVILVTMKDYADCIFNSLVDMRSALLDNGALERVADIVNTFHLEWLQAVHDIDNFKRTVKDIPRETILKAIEYTKKCVKNRINSFQRYVDHLRSIMKGDELILMETDLEIIRDMHKTLDSVLDEKHKCLQNYADQSEYYTKVSDEIEELLEWLDTLNDNLAVQFSKVVGLKLPKLAHDLTKILEQIISDVGASADPESGKLIANLQCKSKNLSIITRLNPTKEFKMKKIIEKIKVYEDRINRLRSENSSAAMALQHKTMYLEERMQSLENLKIALFTLKNKQNAPDLSTCNEYHIFDHLLPLQERCRLVDELIKLWKNAIYDKHEGKSIISILSVTDMKEVFVDDLGNFTVDKYGRKLYKIQDDDNFYQLNERKQLVAISDEKNIYFYDECGRYYLNENKQRIYKASNSASEYLIDCKGVMFKFKDIINDVECWYDRLGQYYKNDDGVRIYIDERTDEEYKHDGLGNLVRIRPELEFYEPCPLEPVVTEENKYLQRTVGEALKKCLAQVILHQPQDPIEYLAQSLVKYRHDIEAQQTRRKDEVKMKAESDLHTRKPASPTQAYLSDEGESKSYVDYNMDNYKAIL